MQFMIVDASVYGIDGGIQTTAVAVSEYIGTSADPHLLVEYDAP
jgi:hypothetical protein